MSKEYLSDTTVTNIYRSFALKMAAKTSWHRYGTKLRHCHHMYHLNTLTRAELTIVSLGYVVL